MGNPFMAWLDAARLTADAQLVIAMRMARVAAGGPFAASEIRRMIIEKLFAFGEAHGRTMLALAGGKDPIGASAAPYRRRVRANRRRLGARHYSHSRS